MDGPGLGEAPALSIAETRPDVLQFELTAQDAVAWIAGTRAERRSLKTLVASTFLASMMGLQVLSGKLPLPDATWARGAELAVVVALPMALALWVRRRGQLAKAHEMLPHPVTVTITQWPDRIEQVWDGKVTTIRPRLLHRLQITRGHILGETETTHLIVPRRAFADRQHMRRMADWLHSQRSGLGAGRKSA